MTRVVTFAGRCPHIVAETGRFGVPRCPQGTCALVSPQRGRLALPAAVCEIDALHMPSVADVRPALRRAWCLVLACAALVLALSAPPADAVDGQGRFFTSPSGEVVVIKAAAVPERPWLPGHRGVDLAVGPAGEVSAPAAGTISYTGFVVSRPVISVTHAPGVVSSFEPVLGIVALGATVERGQAIGTIDDAAPHCSQPCVHWGVRIDGQYVDPLDYLSGFGQVRLLPLDSSEGA